MCQLIEKSDFDGLVYVVEKVLDEERIFMIVEKYNEHWLEDDGTVLFDKIELVDSYQKFYKIGVRLPYNNAEGNE